jgi:hypothetical protein
LRHNSIRGVRQYTDERGNAERDRSTAGAPIVMAAARYSNWLRLTGCASSVYSKAGFLVAGGGTGSGTAGTLSGKAEASNQLCGYVISEELNRVRR